MRARRRVKGVIRANAISEEGATERREHKLTSPPVESTLLSVDIDEAGQPYQGLAASPVHAVSVADVSVGYSPRETKVDRDHVAALADVVDRLPPVIVDERTMTVIDGVHRLEAYRSLGRSRIPALLFRGSDMEALVLAIQANIQHGKPLSRSERQEAARAVLRRCPDRSDRWVGEVCGVSHSTVAVLRRSVSEAEAKIRTGRDGRRRPVDPSLGQAAVARVMAENPMASIRQAAGAAGVAPSTVQRLAAGLARADKPAPNGVTIDVLNTVLRPAEAPVAESGLPLLTRRYRSGRLVGEDGCQCGRPPCASWEPAPLPCLRSGGRVPAQGAHVGADGGRARGSGPPRVGRDLGRPARNSSRLAPFGTVTFDRVSGPSLFSFARSAGTLTE